MKSICKEAKDTAQKVFHVSFDGISELYACKFGDSTYMVIESSKSALKDHILKECETPVALEEAFVYEVLRKTLALAGQFPCWLS